MYFQNWVQKNLSEFLALCQSHKVEKLYAFGSSVTEKFDLINSDIDIEVKLNIENPIERGEMLLSFWNNLELLLHRKVDLLTQESIKNPYLKKSINASKILIYDGQREQILV